MLPEMHYRGHGICIDMTYLAYDLADSLTGDQLIEFILLMDSRKGELDFTEKLYAAIGDELREELEDERT